MVVSHSYYVHIHCHCSVRRTTVGCRDRIRTRDSSELTTHLRCMMLHPTLNIGAGNRLVYLPPQVISSPKGADPPLLKAPRRQIEII